MQFLLIIITWYILWVLIYSLLAIPYPLLAIPREGAPPLHEILSNARGDNVCSNYCGREAGACSQYFCTNSIQYPVPMRDSPRRAQ